MKTQQRRDAWQANGRSEFLPPSEARNASDLSIETLIQSLTTTATGFNKQVQCGLMLNADDTGPQQATGTRARPNGDNRGHAPHPIPLPMGEGTPELSAARIPASLLPGGEGQDEGRDRHSLRRAVLKKCSFRLQARYA